MKRPALYATSFLLLFAASIVALGLGAAVDSPRSLMSPGDYAAGKRAIEVAARREIGRCRLEPAANRELCKAEARAGERVQRAQLAARYLGTVTAAADVRQARVKARYDVERVRCDVQGQGAVDECLRVARDARNRALAEASPSAT